jgi:hypothetical protein
LLDKRLKDISLGAIIGLGLSLPLLYDRGFFSPIPYAYVELLEHSIAPDGDYLTTFNFEKNGCVFQEIQGFGEYLDRWVPVPITFHTDESFSTVENQGDRLKGSQTIHIRFETNDGLYTTLELRTRHLCDGEPVDRVFATLRTKDL